MRADIPTREGVIVDSNANTTKSRSHDYIVAPLHVRDLTTAFAAYFLDWFTSCAADHIADVVRRGLGAGGILEEIEHFRGQCEADVECPDNDLGYWPVEERGPWVFNDVSVVNTAEIVVRHTEGWSPEEFTFYGYTITEKAALDAHVGSLVPNPSRKRE